MATPIDLFTKPYNSLDNAFLDATNHTKSSGEKVHIIKIHGGGYEVVKEEFILDRNYYHGDGGRKIFFDYVLSTKKY